MGARKYNKYGNHKQVVDGHKFDSKAEAMYYGQLKWLLQAKQIKGFKMQPRYLLQEGFKKNGKTYKKIEYVADFEVEKLDGTIEIIDIKGTVTKEFSIKRKLFERQYMDSIKLLKYDRDRGFVEVS